MGSEKLLSDFVSFRQKVITGNFLIRSILRELFSESVFHIHDASFIFGINYGHYMTQRGVFIFYHTAVAASSLNTLGNKTDWMDPAM